MSQIAEIIARNMKRLRADRGIKQEQLAEKSKLSVDTIRNIETGRAWVSKESVAALAHALDAPESELFRSEDSRSTLEQDRLEAVGLLLKADPKRVGTILALLRGLPAAAKKSKPSAG